jgi:hypothetical protein
VISSFERTTFIGLIFSFDEKQIVKYYLLTIKVLQQKIKNIRLKILDQKYFLIPRFIFSLVLLFQLDEVIVYDVEHPQALQ